ncbi:IucA/IucC family C-terminal-domain containing protein [Evansella sp. AB-rgal1]|uniref:IucA/IucC family C-terminal-domain containing protein n=1 Tax=Evansella sp. AB-rgal1 TaxID=3242696 RepID=UPI00359E2725
MADESTFFASLSQEELDYLTENFRLTTNQFAEKQYSFLPQSLVDVATCANYLEELTHLLQSPSMKVTASQFSKRYAFLAIAPSLYAMSMYNKGLHLDVENCYVESNQKDDLWLPRMGLNNMQVSVPEDGNRNAWRDEVIHSIFANNIAKVWKNIATVANVSLSVLWENTGVYVYWLYEEKMGTLGEMDGSQCSIIQGDLEYLVREASSMLFGEPYNPLQKFYSPRCKETSSGKMVRERKTCCYYYQMTSTPAYCHSCPIQFRKKK